MRDMPYFLTNKDWYYVDDNDDDRGYKLTNKAPQEAIDSYNDFYSDTVMLDENTESDFVSYVFD